MCRDGTLLFFVLLFLWVLVMTSVQEANKKVEACFFISQRGGIMLKMVLSAVAIIATMATAQGNDGDTRTITAGGTNIEVVLVKAGSFTMGGSEFRDTATQQVTITEDFWISKYPITQAQYQAVMRNNPSHFSGRPNNPVENVTWHNAVAFATAVGGRLPMEAEWEFAARGGNQSQGFIYSGSDDVNEVAWHSGNSVGGTQFVGQKLPNELGIYDMSGNVWEWVNDWWGNYSNTPQTNPTGPSSGSNRVHRGGSWYGGAERCGVASRGSFRPDGRSSNLGFRVAFNSMTITFNSNGGTAISAINTPWNTTISAPTAPTRNGYTFAGWFRNADGTNEWNFANDIVTTNLTLHARWTPTIYTITYALNGGTNHSSNPANYTIESSTFTLQSPTRNGYDFLGWWTSETSGERVTEISTGSTGDRTLWARWTPTIYTITYLNANENHPLNPATYTIESETITLNAPTATSASTFLGWFDNANLTGTPITEIPAGSTGNKMLYASWRTDYRIMFPAYDTIYDGNEKRYETLELWTWNNLLNNYFFTVILTENIDFEATYANNTNAGTASITVIGKGNFSFIEEETRHFSIRKREIEVIWGNTEFQWNNEYQIPTPSVRSEDEKFTLKLTGQQKDRNRNEEQNFRIYTARVELEDERHIGNIDLKNPTMEFTIGHRIVNVEWGALRTFEYDRRIQHPEWSVDCDLINKDFLYVTNRVAVAGNHRSHIQIIQDNDYPEWHNFRLAGTGVDYEITRRPLTARLRNTGDSIPTSQGLTKEQLDSILTIEIDFDNFAVDSTGADDKSALTGRVRFNIQNDNSQNSLRSQETLASGEHVVTISGESQNYTILERKIVVIIGHRFLILEDYPRATAISNAKKSDSRYGIKFAKNPVSEKAEIGVILPNNERATETKIAIYDMTGNVVWASTGSATGVVWDLHNSAGRFVANGTYLVIAEAKGISGKIYAYSARLGVKR